MGSDELVLATELVVNSFRHFACKLASSVHRRFGWPGTAREPVLLQVVDDAICTLVGDFADDEPSRHGINHSHAKKREVSSFLLVSPLMGTNEIDAQRVPGNRLRFSGRRKSALLVSPLETFTNVAWDTNWEFH